MSDNIFKCSVNRKYLSLCLICLFPSAALAEGSAQIGLNQPLLDHAQSLKDGYAIDSASASLFVDIESAGETINISLCGSLNSDELKVEIFDSRDSSVFSHLLSRSNVDCADPMSGPLNNALEYTSTNAGTYRIELQNESQTGSLVSHFKRYDISVTAPGSSNLPDPTIATGRLWSYSWNIDTGGFSEDKATDTNYYALVPGGRPNSNYIWLLDLNKFAGHGYSIVANNTGVNAPNAGYTVPQSGNSATYKYPIYTGIPMLANPQPVLPPTITGLSFIDSDRRDHSISPSTTKGVQDWGTFDFNSDIEGTYAISIDLGGDGSFDDAGDLILLGEVSTGFNSVSWHGRDATGQVLPAGDYRAQLRLRMGEYHFIANDAETSGGPSDDGLTIYLADTSGSISTTQVYWDDVTALGSAAGGTSTLPYGGLSGTSAGSHTWGDFTGTGFGDSRYVDTYVYGLKSDYTVAVNINHDDAPMTGTDAVVSIPAHVAVDRPIEISVTDADININSTAIDTLTVTLANHSTGENEQAQLRETGLNTGVFVSAVATSSKATSLNNDGLLTANAGDSVSVTYADNLDSTGSAESLTVFVGIGTDFDGDGEPDITDTDDDNDQIPDSVEGTVDSDGDGAIDAQDSDSDNDGIPDSSEGIVGFVDACLPDNRHQLCDTDNDGVTDGEELANNTDPQKADSDADGIPDNLENRDADDDGINDGADTDSDNDGIPDKQEAGINPYFPVDNDADGIPDVIDADSDNDGSPDSVEGGRDSDGDGRADNLDSDSDNDGIPDTVEDNLGTGFDSDNDGIDDGYDVNSVVDGVDANLDGVEDTLSLLDSDGDGIPNQTDIDSDNDGLPDAVEANIDIDADTDGDGINDAYDVNQTGGVDDNGDGVDDAISPVDTDADAAPDYIDLDSDNDSIVDTVEAGGSDTNEDGFIDGPETNAGSLIAPLDTDGDGEGNWRELDSDNDGITDIASTANVALDKDADGVVDMATDSDGDGAVDMIDQNDFFGIAVDSDLDGITDAIEGTIDTDGDGLPDRQDTDSDGDGIPDAVETNTDTDGDGVANYIDTDSDNDNIGDILEGNQDTDGNGIPDYLQSDTGLETALTGAGAYGGFSFFIVIAALLRGQRQISALKSISIVCLCLNFLLPTSAEAHSLCSVDDQSQDSSITQDENSFYGCWYVGLGAGYSSLEPKGSANNFYLNPAGDHDAGYQLVLGKQLTPQWFAELKYANLGKADITNSNPAIDAAFPDAAISYRVPSFMLGYLWREKSQWTPYAKFGISAIKNKALGGPVPFDAQSELQFAYGVGLNYGLPKSRWFIRGNVDLYDKDAWFASFSLGRSFVKKVEESRESTQSNSKSKQAPQASNIICYAKNGSTTGHNAMQITSSLIPPEFERYSNVLLTSDENTKKLDEIAKVLITDESAIAELSGHMDSVYNTKFTQCFRASALLLCGLNCSIAASQKTRCQLLATEIPPLSLITKQRLAVQKIAA